MNSICNKYYFLDYYATVDDTETYTAFHSFWNDIDLDASHMVVHYEHITSKREVSNTLQSVLQFLDNISPVGSYLRSNNIDMMVQRARNVIREPKYTHGTLVSRICGKDVAKLVHDATVDYSTPLGYLFDENTGFWSLKDNF